MKFDFGITIIVVFLIANILVTMSSAINLSALKVLLKNRKNKED